MGIQNYLKRVSKATKDIKSAIEEKGVPVAMCDGYEQLADKVRAIQVGSSVEASDMLFTILAFKQSTSMPGTPTGGSFSETKITYPSGWTDGAGLTENVWMSYCVIKGDGSVYKNWVTPIKLSGVSSSDTPSIDLTDYALKSWVTEQLSKLDFNEHIDLSAYATKTYVQNEIAKIQTGGSVDLSNYATKSYVDSRDSEVIKTAQTGWELGDDETLKSAKSYADALVSGAGVSSLNSMTGDITLMGSDSVSISRSGKSLIFTASGGSGGGDGKDGDTIRSFNIYINTDSNTDIPEIPVNSAKMPYWNYSTGELDNCPTGWATDMVSDPKKYTWMAVGFFSKNSAGAQVGTWEGPLCITGEPGKPGEDGASMEFIYALTPDADRKPNYPTTAADLKKLFDDAENNNSTIYNGQRWYDRAQSIDPTTNRACWMAQRVKYAGAEDWSVYSSTPVIWANWGSDGTDGDGVEYIFFLTDDAHQSAGKWYSDAENFAISYTELGTVNGVETTYDNTVDDWVPKGWTDEPQDVSETDGFYEFCAIRKSANGVWGEFSTPSLWAKYAMDGKDGASVEYVFATCSEELTPEQVSVDNDAANRDGAGTTDEYLPNFNFNGTVVKATDDPVSVSETVPYQWVSIRRRKRGESVWQDFSHPSLWNMWAKGSQGPRGEDGDTIEEVYAVYNSVAVMPTINASATDANGKTATDDGYLPNFMFGTTAVAASIELLSVDSTNRYLFKSRRRKHNGTWLSYSDPVVAGNWTETELSPEEIEKLKDNIKTDVKDSLTEANQRVEALQTRLDSIDYTNATFIKDPDNALIAAITQYKDANQKSFADLVVDGKAAEIKALAGAEVNEHLTEAGITIDGLGAKLKSFADYQDKTTNDIQTVASNLDAVKGTLTNYATTENLENVNSVVQTLNGKTAELISSVSKSTYVWVKKDSEGNVIADSTVAYDASQYLAKDAAYADKDKYEAAMEAQGYELDLSVHAFSQIKQAAGEVDITAGDGKAAQLKIYGDNDTSRIIMKAEQVDFSGNMNGKGMVVTDLTVTGTKGEIDPVTKLPQLGATINTAYINECQINSCEIASQIKSKTYVAHDDTKNQEGKGFLIDAGAVKADGLEFAFYGQTSDGHKFELTNNSLVIPSAVIGDVTVDTIQSKNYSEDSAGNPNINLTEDGSVGFKLSSSANKFYVKGTNYELNDGTISLENTDSLILGDKSFTEWLKNAGTWDEFITDIKGDLNVEGSITAEALYAKNSNYVIKIGDTVDQGTTERFTYSGFSHSHVWRDHSTKKWTYDDVSTLKQTISVKTGTQLIIPSIVVGWTIHAVTTGTINTLPSARLLVKNSGGTAVIDTGFIAGKDGGGRTSLSGTAGGTNYYGNVIIDRQVATITPGTYSVEIEIQEEHLGANMLHASSFRFHITDTIITAVKQGETETGVSIGGNGILVKAGEQGTSGDITEASLISQNGKIVSTGFVLSDDITRIKTVADKDKAAAENDPNTIYIILNI